MTRRTLLALLACGLAAALGPPPGSEAALGPYLTGVTPRSVMVCFETDGPAVGTVRYGSRLPLEAARTEASPVRLHRVRLTGLAPNTRYLYQVSAPGVSAGTYEFHTAARPGDPFTFVVYGDNRSQPHEHVRVVAAMRRLDPRFVLHTGDMVASGVRRAQWVEFFQAAGPLLARSPLFAVPGNHEGNSYLFLQYLGLPGARRYYSFDYGDVHFVALDSNDPALHSEAQRAWLEADLKASQSRLFTVVLLHRPLYTSVTIRKRAAESAEVRGLLEGLFRRYGVDLVLSGHDHNYQHHLVRGMHFVVTGGGGAPLYSVKARPYTLRNVAEHHFLEVSVAGRTLTVRALTPEGKELDRFTLRAASGGGR